MVQRRAFLTADVVYDVRCAVERELIWSLGSTMRPLRTVGEKRRCFRFFVEIFIAKWRIWQALEISQSVQLDTQIGSTSMRTAISRPAQNLVGLTMGLHRVLTRVLTLSFRGKYRLRRQT